MFRKRIDNLPAIRSTFRNRAGHYDDESEWVTNREILQLLVPVPFGTGEACDYCAGTGVVGRALQKHGWSVLALDISPEMLSRIEGQIIRRLECNVIRVPLPAKCFDLVVCRQGLQYLPVQQALAEMARLAKAEIRIAHITTENDDDRSAWLAYFEIASPGRLHVFYPGQLAKSCRSLGLSVTSEVVMHTWGPFLGPVQHLSAQETRSVMKWLSEHRSMMTRHYGLKRMGEGEYWYSQRWEIIHLSLCS